MILCVLFLPHVKIGKFELELYWVPVLLGAALTVLTGQIDLRTLLGELTANNAVNPLKILVLFISMTVLSIFLDEVGFFGYIANEALKRAKASQLKLFLYLYVTVSVLTVFTSNDIIILTFTPFICCFAKSAHISPVPYLVAEFVAANTWSMALMIGNPTNIYLSATYGVGFLEYARIMLLPTVACGLVAAVVLWLLFRKKLSEPICPERVEVKITSRLYLVFGLVHLGLCTVVLAVSSYVGLEMWAVSLFAVVSLFVFCGGTALIKKEKPRELLSCLKRAPWQLVPFVLSMFVLILVISNKGETLIMNRLLGHGNIILKYGIASFLSTELINNIPMSVLFCSVIKPLAGAEQLRAVFAAVTGSNLGALLTPIGALAGIMWSSMLKERGVKFGYGQFIKYGAAVSVPALMTVLGVLSAVLA